jgi:hypothetical protein
MRFSLALPKTDWWKVLGNAAIVGGAAFLTYVSEHMVGSDFGIYQPVVVAAIAVVIDILRKAIQNDDIHVIGCKESEKLDKPNDSTDSCCGKKKCDKDDKDKE